MYAPQAIGDIGSLPVDTKRNVNAKIASDSVPTEQTDGKLVNEFADTFGRRVAKETNLSTESADTSPISASPLATQKQVGITQLTAPGYTSPIGVEDYAICVYAVTVAAIDTTVVLELYGNIDETNFGILELEDTANADATITDNAMTITANGTYFLVTKTPVSEIKLRFESETGGTAATIDADFLSKGRS